MSRFIKGNLDVFSGKKSDFMINDNFWCFANFVRRIKYGFI